MKDISTMRAYKDGSLLWNGVKYVTKRTCRNLSPNKSVGGFLCSECGLNVWGGVGGSLVAEDGTRKRFSEIYPLWEYCPHCGAEVV
jgi:predicted RNA-binding Zn-ribbon protein involved in translation (DUF1610 family)